MAPEDHARDMAKEAAGNWQKFESFGWHDQPEDADAWTIVYTHNRDSGLVDQSNADAIAEILAPFEDGDDPDVRTEHHGHWACGWIRGFAIRVYVKGSEGTAIEDRPITPAFQAYVEVQLRLEDYPLLDEDDHSRREYEATLENIESAGRRFVRDPAPEGWAVKVLSWLWKNDQSAVEAHDDQGGYPSDDQIQQALRELGWLDEDEDEDENGDEEVAP